MAIEQYFPTIPEDGSGTDRQIASVVRSLVDGKMNNRGEVELTTASATTTITDDRIGPESQIDLMPLDANAAAEVWWISGRDYGTATINHTNNALVRLFQYAIIG